MVTDKMSLPSRIEYLKKVKPRYLKASKEDKSNILDEFCKNIRIRDMLENTLLGA